MKKSRAVTAVLIAGAVILALVAVAFGIAAAMYNSGKRRIHENTSKPSLPSDSEYVTDGVYTGNSQSEPVDFIEADAYHNGKAYRYRDELVSFLVIGADKNSSANGAHRADAIYLVVYDDEAKHADVIAISRNTYAVVDVYNDSGELFGIGKMQICLAYSYGKDDKMSSELTVNAVSRLLYGLPIGGYFTLFMDEVPEIVDAVGGVPIRIPCDMTDSLSYMTEGSEVTLNSDNVMTFLRWRNDSNSVRVNNQIEFIKAFMSVVKTKVTSDPIFALTLFNSVSGISVTNITYDTVVYLVQGAADVTVGDIYNIEGTSDVLNGAEVVYLDDNLLYEMLLDKFYEEIK